MLTKVAVIDDYHEFFDSDPSIARLRQRLPVDVYTKKLASLDPLRDYQALIALRERTKFDAAFFEAVPNLELIAQTGNHAYHVDLDAATKAGVLVALGSSDLPASAGIASSTIELTFGLMLAIMRRIPHTDQAIRHGQWPLVLGRSLHGKKLGILGLGRIGRQVARIAQAFGMQVSAWGPTLTPERAAESNATYLDLDELLETSDVVSVHLALSDMSRGLLNEERLRRIGPDSWLVNTSRGAIVDEAALARVLQAGALGGAALDVFTEEPLAANSPLIKLDNVVLTAHLGWPSDSTYRYMAEATVRSIEAYMDGRLDKALNPEAAAHQA